MYQKLTDKLSKSVEGGEFLRILLLNARTCNCSDFHGANVTLVKNYPVHTEIPGGKVDLSLSAIIAIIIAIIVIAALVLTSMYTCCFYAVGGASRYQVRPADDAIASPSEETAGADQVDIDF